MRISRHCGSAVLPPLIPIHSIHSGILHLTASAYQKTSGQRNLEHHRHLALNHLHPRHIPRSIHLLPFRAIPLHTTRQQRQHDVRSQSWRYIPRGSCVLVRSPPPLLSPSRLHSNRLTQCLFGDRYIPYKPETSEITACGIPQNYDASKEFKDKKVVLVAVPGTFVAGPTSSRVLGSPRGTIEEIEARHGGYTITIANLSRRI